MLRKYYFCYGSIGRIDRWRVRESHKSDGVGFDYVDWSGLFLGIDM
jgi:hypothetical protein